MTKVVSTPREIVAIPNSASPIPGVLKTVLVKTDQVEIVHFAMHGGADIPRYEAQGELILHCLSGHVSVRAGGECHELDAGHLLYLLLGDPFSIYSAKDASVLVTIVAAKAGASVDLIGE